MRRGLSILLAMSLVVAACGGSSDEESVSTTSTEAKTDAGTEPPAADTSTTAAQPPAATEDPVASGADGTATATVGDMTWDFTFTGNDGREMCDPDAGGIGLFVMIMYGVDDDGQEVALSISFPTSDGGAQVTVGDPIMITDRWVADSEVYDRLANIQGMPEGVGAAAQVDGNSISGSGVFYEDKTLNEARQTGDPYDAGVLEGTFSATCPAG